MSSSSQGRCDGTPVVQSHCVTHYSEGSVPCQRERLETFGDRPLQRLFPWARSTRRLSASANRRRHRAATAEPLDGFWGHRRVEVDQVSVWIAEQDGAIPPRHGGRLLDPVVDEHLQSRVLGVHVVHLELEDDRMIVCRAPAPGPRSRRRQGRAFRRHRCRHARRGAPRTAVLPSLVLARIDRPPLRGGGSAAGAGLLLTAQDSRPSPRRAHRPFYSTT